MKKLLSLTVAITIAIGVTAQDWHWMNPLPVGISLFSVFFTDVNTGYAAGDHGTIIKTINGGANWSLEQSNTDNLLWSIFFPDPQIGYAVGNGGTIVKTTDGGLTWITQTSGTNNSILSCTFVNPATGFAVGANGTILKTTDGGVSWIGQTSGTTLDLTSVVFTDALTGFIVGRVSYYFPPNPGYIILKTTDGGANWSVQSSGTSFGLNSVSFPSSNTGFAVGDGGNILITTNGGTDWISNTIGYTYSLFSVCFTDVNNGFAAAANMIFKTTDGGNTWTTQTIGGGYNYYVNSVHFLNPTTGYLVGLDTGPMSCIIFKSADGGYNWNSLVTSVTSVALFDAYFPDAMTGYAVGQNSVILKTSDGGNTWITQNSSTNEWLRGVYFTDVSTGYIVGESSTIQKTINGGVTWTPQTSVNYGHLRSVYFPDLNTGYAVGGSYGNGFIVKTTNSGNNWTLQTNSINSYLSEVFFTNTNTGYAVGEHGTILKTYNGGLTWSPQTSGTTTHPLRSVFFTDMNTGFVVGENGIILRTLNGGLDWSMQTINTSWGFTSIKFLDSNNGYIVGCPGVILKTTDGGTSWTVLPSLTYNCLWTVCYPDSNHVYAVGNYGTIIGKTQQSLVINNVISTNVTCNGMNNGKITIFAVGGSGTLQYSIDNGATWFANGGEFTSLAPNDYYVKVKDTNSTIMIYAGNPVVITQPPELVISSVNSTNITCNGYNDGSITIMASGGTGILYYSIYNGYDWLANGGYFTDVSYGFYSIMVKDNNECSISYANNPVIISEPPPILINEVIKTDVTNIGGNDGTITVHAYGGVFPLQYSIDNGTSWQMSDYFVGLSAGSYYVVVKDFNNCLLPYTQNPIIIYEPLVGIGNPVIKENIKLYPNPTTGIFTISVKELNEIESIEILDHWGNIIVQKNVQQDSQGGLKYDFNMSEQPDGLYFLKIRNKFSVYIKKIVII